ncbi:3332_t:CDS:2, partial [Dentiscutata erythropus]
MSSSKVVLLDIEGTTTPIPFVHEKLKPKTALREDLKFLDENWSENEMKENIQLLREQ